MNPVVKILLAIVLFLVILQIGIGNIISQGQNLIGLGDRDLLEQGVECRCGTFQGEKILVPHGGINKCKNDMDVSQCENAEFSVVDGACLYSEFECNRFLGR
ncbi:MAG: hypothetical protein ACMXX7_01245 [Candidatus Woesearchaeota archaeon]